jgi:hypothetical protein
MEGTGGQTRCEQPAIGPSHCHHHHSQQHHLPNKLHHHGKVQTIQRMGATRCPHQLGVRAASSLPKTCPPTWQGHRRVQGAIKLLHNRRIWTDLLVPNSLIWCKMRVASPGRPISSNKGNVCALKLSYVIVRCTAPEPAGAWGICPGLIWPPSTTESTHGSSSPPAPERWPPRFTLEAKKEGPLPAGSATPSGKQLVGHQIYPRPFDHGGVVHWRLTERKSYINYYNPIQMKVDERLYLGTFLTDPSLRCESRLRNSLKSRPSPTPLQLSAGRGVLVRVGDLFHALGGSNAAKNIILAATKSLIY